MEHTKKVIELQIATLTQDVRDKKAMVKRLALLYNLTIFNIVAIMGGFMVYYLVFYIRRKFRKASEETS